MPPNNHIIMHGDWMLEYCCKYMGTERALDMIVFWKSKLKLWVMDSPGGVYSTANYFGWVQNPCKHVSKITSGNHQKLT